MAEVLEIWVDAAEPYGLSATAPATAREVFAPRSTRRWAGELVSLAKAHPLVMFVGLLDDVDFATLRMLFAVLRDEIVRIADDQRAALVPPITSAATAESPFPLHCDLFVAERLFNVFNAVPNDGSGAALILPLEEVERILATSGAPRPVWERARRLLRRELGGRDSFDELMALLYAPEHAWSAPFARAAVANSLRLDPRRGDGYLLDDSRFMHGRTATTSDVPEDRLVRLVFASDPERVSSRIGMVEKVADTRIARPVWPKARVTAAEPVGSAPGGPWVKARRQATDVR